jgi:hypothetical protein
VLNCDCLSKEAVLVEEFRCAKGSGRAYRLQSTIEHLIGCGFTISTTLNSKIAGCSS